MIGPKPDIRFVASVSADGHDDSPGKQVSKSVASLVRVKRELDGGASSPLRSASKTLVIIIIIDVILPARPTICASLFVESGAAFFTSPLFGGISGRLDASRLEQANFGMF